VMGYQLPPQEAPAEERSLEDFAASIDYPIVIVGLDGPESFLLNKKAFEILDLLDLPEGSWKVIEPVLTQS